MSRQEIRITGFGGQGVVLCGYIIGRAFAIDAGRHATMIQSFGPEARGSSCSTTLALSEEEILYPYVTRPDILVTMSAEGYDKYRDELTPDGLLIYERNLVPVGDDEPHRRFSVPSTRLAESLGRPIVQNIVMLGFFSAVTRCVSREQMRAAVGASVPAGTQELNLRAFDAGWDYFQEAYGAPQADGEPSRAEAGVPAG